MVAPYPSFKQRADRALLMEVAARRPRLALELLIT
jgi:hypothetical protein